MADTRSAVAASTKPKPEEPHMTGHQAYRGRQVHTSSPLELVLLAYEVLSSATHRARIAQQQKDYAAEAGHVQHALAAVTELMNGLDYDAGGTIAANLGSLYLYITRRLLAAQGSNDPAIYDEVIALVNELRSAWTELKARQERPVGSARRAGEPESARVAMAA